VAKPQNCLPSKALNGNSPFEARFNKLSTEAFIQFGATVVFIPARELTRKMQRFSRKGKTGVYLGNKEDSHLVWDVESWREEKKWLVVKTKHLWVVKGLEEVDGDETGGTQE